MYLTFLWNKSPWRGLHINKMMCGHCRCLCVNNRFPQCTCPIFHNAQLDIRNVYTYVHFCYKTMHCGIFVWCIVAFVRDQLHEIPSGNYNQMTDHWKKMETSNPHVSALALLSFTFSFVVRTVTVCCGVVKNTIRTIQVTREAKTRLVIINVIRSLTMKSTLQKSLVSNRHCVCRWPSAVGC